MKEKANQSCWNRFANYFYLDTYFVLSKIIKSHRMLFHYSLKNAPISSCILEELVFKSQDFTQQILMDEATCLLTSYSCQKNLLYGFKGCNKLLFPLLRRGFVMNCAPGNCQFVNSPAHGTSVLLCQIMLRSHPAPLVYWCCYLSCIASDIDVILSKNSLCCSPSVNLPFRLIST